MKSIEVYYLELNGVQCRFYWCEVNGVESMLMGLNGVEYTSDDPRYYDDCTIEEWVGFAVIEGCRKHDKLIDESGHTVIELFILDKETYFQEGI